MIYINDIYHLFGLFGMSAIGTAKLFKHGRSQAVRLPKEFRLPGTEVRVRRVGRSVILEPIDEPFDVKAWFGKLDAPSKNLVWFENSAHMPMFEEPGKFLAALLQARALAKK